MADPPIDTGPTPWRKAGWVICGLALIGLFAAMYGIAPRLFITVPVEHRPIGLLVAIWSAAGLVFLVAAALLYKARPMNGWWLVWIGLVGLVCRAILFFSTPICENDFYRYLWDGALVCHALSPYQWSPLQAREGHAPHLLTELADQAPQVVYRINFPQQRSMYPPVSEIFLALAHRIAPWNPLALRGVFIAFDLLTAILIALALARMHRPVEWAMLYWWCPILIKDFVNGIHLDPIVIFFVAAAVVVVMYRWTVLAYGLLGLAIGAKLWPVVLLPLFLRFTWPDRRGTVLGMVGLIALASLIFVPYFHQHQGQSSGLVRYVQAWENNTAHFHPLLQVWQTILEARGIHPGHAQRYARYTLAVMMVLWLAWLSFHPIPDSPRFVWRCTLAVSGLFLISPTQFPWYYGWVVLFLAMRPWWPLLAYAALLPLYHLHYNHPQVTWLEHAPIWALLLIWLIHRWVVRPTSLEDITASLPAP